MIISVVILLSFSYTTEEAFPENDREKINEREAATLLGPLHYANVQHNGNYKVIACWANIMIKCLIGKALFIYTPVLNEYQMCKTVRLNILIFHVHEVLCCQPF